jgi:hypothetical protein
MAAPDAMMRPIPGPANVEALGLARDGLAPQL